LDYKGSDLVDLATQAILDSKHFVKEWPFIDEEDQFLRFICRLMPKLCDVEADQSKRELPPGEIIVVPLHTTVRELKRAVESALRDTYCITEEFLIMEISELEELDDGELLFGAVESGAELCVRGSGIGLENRLRYQGGADSWTVRCECGAQDDDGERMVECTFARYGSTLAVVASRTLRLFLRSDSIYVYTFAIGVGYWESLLRATKL
jgi:hypothetical protein